VLEKQVQELFENRKKGEFAGEFGRYLHVQ